MTKGRSLSKATRGAIIALYKYNTMSFVEIGLVLNIPRDTVRMTYKRIAVRKTISDSQEDIQLYPMILIEKSGLNAILHMGPETSMISSRNPIWQHFWPLCTFYEFRSSCVDTTNPIQR